MASSNFESEIKDSMKSQDRPGPKHRPKPPMRATEHNPDTVAQPPPEPHAFTDTTAQGGLEVPSPVGDGSVTQMESLPSGGGDLSAGGMVSGDPAAIEDPILAEAVQTIIAALMGRQGAMV